MSVWMLMAVRAVLEMLVYLLLGRTLLGVLAGQGRHDNLMYRFFSWLTDAPRKLTARCFGLQPESTKNEVFCVFTLAVFWVLAGVIKLVVTSTPVIQN